jgi:membrane associated rhomboid family serine protease
VIIPYGVDVPQDRKPFANWLICGLIVAVFLQQIAVMLKYGAQIAFEQQQKQQQGQQQGGESKPAVKNPLDAWVLHGWNLQGMIGHMWLHAGIFHLAGNLLFLWIAGNAVCSKIGNLSYLLIYLLCGFSSAAAHNIFQGGPAIGASGAIAGVMGMFLVLYPENDVKCVWIWLIFLIIIRPTIVSFTCSSYWLILAWLALEVYGAATSVDMVAHFAHLGGFAAGFVIAVFMLEHKWVTMKDYEKSLLQLVGLEKRKGVDQMVSDYGRGWEPWQQEIAESQGQAEAKQGATIPFDPPAEAAPVQPMPPPAELQPGAASGAEFVRVLCSCGRKVKFPAKYAGRTGRCPACNSPLTIPGTASGAAASPDESMIRFTCKCGKRIKVASRYSGRVAQCPQCHARIRVP